MNEIIFNQIDKNVWCEVRYLDNIIDYLNKYLIDFTIIVTPDVYFLPKSKYKKIVILTGNYFLS